ncbi:sensor histidine kinase [Pedobacter polaris]|nr:histidine kinase [Pedobacter polaris]
MFLSAGTTTLPEILFAYYLIYVAYEKLANKKGSQILNFIQLAIMLVICVTLVRLSGFYILNNLAYEKKLSEKVLWDWAVMWRSLIYFGFSSGLALSLRLFRKQVTAARREKALVEEKLNIELKQLRNQLNPHFLFNTLNNIYSLTRKKSDLAPDAVLKLSDLLDFMLYKAEADTISLENEIQFLEDYISLEKIRYSDRLALNFKKDTHQPTPEIAPLILLPLVENAFKHGASESGSEVSINIEITQREMDFNFTIENTFDPIEYPNPGGNIGLKNVMRRLELIYKEHNIKINSKSNLFRVTLYINLDSYGKA